MKKDNLQHSLRSADVFTVVASLPPKDDRKYVCASQATFNKNFNEFVLSAKARLGKSEVGIHPCFSREPGARKQATRIVDNYITIK